MSDIPKFCPRSTTQHHRFLSKRSEITPNPADATSRWIGGSPVAALGGMVVANVNVWGHGVSRTGTSTVAIDADAGCRAVARALRRPVKAIGGTVGSTGAKSEPMLPYTSVWNVTRQRNRLCTG